MEPPAASPSILSSSEKSSCSRCDEAVRVVQVGRRRQHVRVRPQGVAAVDPARVRQRGPQPGGVPQPARPQLQPDQRGEGLLRRAAGRATAAQGLAQRVRRRQARFRRPRAPPRPPSPRPAREQSPDGPAPPSAPGCPPAGTCPAAGRPAAAPGSAGRTGRPRPPAWPVSTLMPRAYPSTAPNRWDAQPRHVGEQPLVGGLAQGEIQPDLLLGHAQALPNASTFSRQQRGLAGRAQRQPDVGGADDLARQHAHAPARSGRRTSRRPWSASCRSAGRPWPASPRAAHRPCAAPTRSATGSTSSFHAGRVASTHSARLQATAVLGAGGQRGHAVEPQVGQAHRLLDRGHARRGRHSRPCVPSGVPWETVWRAMCLAMSQFTGTALVAEHLAELLEGGAQVVGVQRTEHGGERIVRTARAAGQRRRTRTGWPGPTTTALGSFFLPSSPSSGSSGGRPNPNGVSLTGFLGS